MLDLRGNGGGLLSEAVLVSSIFIEDGKIVSVRGRRRPERTEDAEGDAIDEDIPVVVLVDGGSASASEIVTGALRDRGRATIVGTRTFGKGLVQEVEQLSNGGVLDLTVANYYLPGGKTISTRGIKPQVRAAGRPGHRARRGAARGGRRAAARAAMSTAARGGRPAGWTRRWWPCSRSAAASWWPSRSSATGRAPRWSAAARAPATWCWWAPASAARAWCACWAAPTAPATWWRA